MLILSRKAGESIFIGDNIRITVTSIRGQCVRLGIEAPGDVGIYREELIFNNPYLPSAPGNDSAARVGAYEERGARTSGV